MERNKKTPLLFRLLIVFQVYASRMDTCPVQPDKHLSCYTDYNQNISCVWDSTNQPVNKDTVCTLHAKKTSNLSTYNKYSASCHLEPDIVNPSLKRCTLVFDITGRFLGTDVLSISLSCQPPTEVLTVSYKPSCHIKLSPPGKPLINSTTATWFSQVIEHGRITSYHTQLQWKRRDQSWIDPTVQMKQMKEKTCARECDAQLDDAPFGRGRGLQVRVRVRVPPDNKFYKSVWSDWSPAASEPSDFTPDFPGSTLGMSIAGAAVALVLAGLFFKFDKATLVYKKIRGASSPDPGKSFLKDVNFQSWLGPHSAGESFHSPPKLEDISSVEVISSMDAVALCGKEAPPLEKTRSESSYESTSSGFSNPSYSQLCTPAPISLTVIGTTDTRDGSNAGQDGGKSAEQEREEILQLLSKGNDKSSSSEPVPVISDYEKVEKLQVERQRLQSLDSGMCSGEEVSQESLEADSIGATESQGEKEKEGGRVNFQELFGGGGNVIGQGSIQVCSDYEQVQKLQPGSPELCSLDSGLSGGCEEQASHEVILEEVDKSTELTKFLFPSPAPGALTRPMVSFPQPPLQLRGADLSAALLSSRPSHIMERMALMSASRSVEPSGDGYMPVRQETD